MHPILESFIAGLGGFSPEEQAAIAARLQVGQYPKGTMLLREGQLSRYCYFVLKGCIRQYKLEAGEEKTVQFYTEHQAVTLFFSFGTDQLSEYYLSCEEDTLLIAGTVEMEQEMYQEFPKVQELTRSMMEQDFGRLQQEYARFIATSPEERYLNLLQNRPDLLQRVPQYQVASYIGVTPESLSRIRKRLGK